MSPEIEIMLIASVVATACVLPGVFLVLRGVSLMSDAISHSILLGIVVMFFLVGTIESPWLILGATLAGLLSVTITEIIIHTKRLKEDAAIGLVFPVFFSVGVILITKFAGDIHIDADAVLLGELAFAPFNRMHLFGLDVGPYALWVMGLILVLNVTLLVLFYKELKLATFDKGLASSLGFSPALIYYGLMAVTSLTSVGAFDAVGSILVVALMIAPPSAAFLITDRLSRMIGISIVIGILSALSGYSIAHATDTSIAGAMATMSGVFFLAALFFSPSRGLVHKLREAKKQKIVFSGQMLLVQLLDHEHEESDTHENTISNMIHHMGWTTKFSNGIARYTVQKGYVTREGRHLHLTPLGREIARTVMTE